MWKAHVSAAALQKDAMQGRKKPCLGAVLVAQLVAFNRPDIKRLLGEVASVGFGAREAKGKPVKRFIVLLYNALETRASHTLASRMRGMVGLFVPEENKKLSLEQIVPPALLTKGRIL
jgi:hypothetical protein